MIKKIKTKNTFEIIKEAVKVALGEMDIATKEDLKYLPTKEDFYSRMDEVMGELKTVREEQSGLSQHDKDQFDAIEALQKIHPHNSHPAFA